MRRSATAVIGTISNAAPAEPSTEPTAKPQAPEPEAAPRSHEIASRPPEQARPEVLPEGTLNHLGKPMPFVKRLKRAPGWTRSKERAQIASNRGDARAKSRTKQTRAPARDARKKP